MAAEIQIKYVSGHTVAFTVNMEIYYLKTGPDYPMVFDRNLKRMLIPNLDSWIQAISQQRHSYRGLLDMMRAFSDGLQHSYSSDDLQDICERVFDLTYTTIFHTEHTREYARAHKVELLDPKSVEPLIMKLKEQFDVYKARGENEFFNYLCRLWQFCLFYQPSNAIVFERFIQRLNKTPQAPVYSIPENHNQIKATIVKRITHSEMLKFKGIDDEVIEVVNSIQANKRF